jgi:hypothetical protein
VKYVTLPYTSVILTRQKVGNIVLKKIMKSLNQKKMKFLKKIKLLALMPILLAVGCNDDDEPTVLQPEVVSTSPINEDTNIGTNSTVEVKFNKDMNAASINASTFTLFNGTSQVEGTVSYADSTAIFTPVSNLTASKTFIATITKEVKDVAGTSLKSDYKFSFTSGLAPDITVPTITLTDPLNNATDVLFDKAISITFSEAMDVSTINTTSFTLKQGTTAIAGAVSNAGNTATFTPTAILSAGLVYTATVSTSVTDVSGIALAAAKVWSFTTDALPTVAEVSPINGKVDVALNAKVLITFSEAMDAASFTANSFMVKQGTSTVSGVVSYTGNTATFTPNANLAPGLVYVATVTTDVKNLNGNAIAAAKTWEFTSDALPTALSVDPLNNATNVARNKVISITFSEAMTLSTINTSSFTLMQGVNAITGTISFSGNTARFIPNVILSSSLVYTATVNTDVKDLAGNSMLADKVWSFTTGTVSGLAVVNLGASGNYVILAKTAINNIPTSAITGDMGLSPAATSYITGFALTNATGYATSTQVTGKVYAADMASPTGSNLTTAVENMLTAYTDAAGRPTPDELNLLSGNIGGQTLAPGLYKWGSSVTMSDDVTLSGSADDVWIFQIDNDLTMSADVNILLLGAVQTKNIFWQVAGEAVIGANSHFEGIILSQTGITLQTGASYKGRMLAQTAVILDQNAVTKP